MTELRIPGPTPCPPEVLQALSRQMIDHRGGEFVKIMTRVTDKLKQVFMTKNDVLVLTGSGTGGLEATIVNMLSPGDKVLAVTVGEFGDRFIKIAQTFGADVVPLRFEPGIPADPDEIKKALQANPAVTAVLVTHNETSTGVTNDMGAIASVVKGAGKLLLVDCISGMGSLKCPVDEWKLDVAISASQKGWMVPPGLVFVSISPEAWQAHARAKMPRFYWDFTRASDYLQKGQTPWTPAVSIFFALDVALDMMLKEGLPNIVARHARIGQITRDGVTRLGLPLFAQKSHASNTVTAARVVNGLDAKKLLKIMREENKIVISGGQGKLEGQLVRIGHLGYVDEKDITAVISAMKSALPKAGFGGA